MGSGVLAKLGSVITAKTAAVAAAGALVVSGAVGVGVWAVNGGPQLVVVQRSASVSVPARGEQAAIAPCQAHEKALGGGYAVTGTGFATSSLFVGDAWLTAAYNPDDAPATLTSYALCINAKPQFLGGVNWSEQAHAFHDRGNKMTSASGGGTIHDLTTDGPFADTAEHATAWPSCSGDFTPVGIEFRAGRTVSGRAVAPAPLDSLTTKSAGAGVTNPVPKVALNPGTRLSTAVFPLRSSEFITHQTRIEDPQPPEANYAVAVRPICVRLKSVSVATVKVAVAAGGSGDAAVSCPKGKLIVGGGFQFPADNESGGVEAPARFFGDGWLYAPTDAPAAGESSGSKVKAWHVTGRNQQKAGLDYYNSVWIEHSDRETLTGNGYFDTHGRGPDDQVLRALAVPDSQEMVASAVCATIDAKPTEPAKAPSPPVVTRPELPHALDPLPGATGGTGSASPSAPTPGASPTTSPTASPGTSPTPGSPNSPGTPTTGGPSRPATPSQGSSPTRQQPQAPTVSIQQPGAGGQLRRGCEESFAGTARTRPGSQPVTDPQYTSWRITGPNGPVTLGAGASGRFLVPLLPDGTYKLVFSATDPAAGLTGSAEVSVKIVGCLR
ncbi:hypothetical protein OHB36_22430 [Streptomyces sp. NBC_00320]|uniref:hypothetical protein n=1 Tax=unclassified Streptomyces TaxID=2593676 RepID=UPI002252100C|nr:hypothetical protein [Streptomyces sp. NBC_00320]MCX5149500.1 hypothetical protein [Streptomyces sp. NBC_00320]